jgi:DNA-binding GntR family transcriptional regulator
MTGKETEMNRQPALTRVALADQVTALLMERILDRAYAPGQKLNIDALSREFEVSSSPIREALSRLAAVGLVTSATFTGFSVAPEPSREWFEQLRDFRILNEGWAARRLARSRDPQAIARMRESIRSMEAGSPRRKPRDYVGASRADETFHEAMLEASGNEVLAQAVRSLHPHLHHARLFSRTPHDIAPMLDEHRAILDAIERGDEDAAQAAVEAHLQTSWRRYSGWHADQPDRR